MNVSTLYDVSMNVSMINECIYIIFEYIIQIIKTVVW